jgi:hypothetical protein
LATTMKGKIHIMEQVALKDAKPGEFIRRKPDSRITYRRGEYDRSQRKYALEDWDDHCREIYLKGSTMVWVGFTY